MNLPRAQSAGHRRWRCENGVSRGGGGEGLGGGGGEEGEKRAPFLHPTRPQVTTTTVEEEDGIGKGFSLPHLTPTEKEKVSEGTSLSSHF